MATREDRQGQAGRLIYLLKHALLELEDLHAEHLEPVGISSRDLGVLLLLDGAGEGLSQQQAAARLGVDRTTMVALLDALEAKDLVARRTSAQDRRRNVLELTEHGQDTLARAIAASDKAEQQFLAALGDAGSSKLRTLLRRLVP